jgi:diguanylate cyclase (GGDEF)-like protein
VKILSKNLLVQENVGADNSQMVFERLQSVSQDLMSVASQYGALFKDWASSNKQLQMLNSLARQINETLVLDDVLPQVLKLTLELTNAERGFLLLRENRDADTLVVRAGLDRYDRSILDGRLSHSVCQKVITTGQAVTVLDASLDDDFKDSKSIASLSLRTLMCVPLQSKGRAVGVLYVDSQAVVATFTEKDLELLQAIASHASVAIENAMLYADLNRRAAELEDALEAYRRADKDANTDMLTGLANRRFFEKQAAIHIETSRRYTRDLSVIVLDVDFFKKFNDTYGHAIGDEVLKVLGTVLPECVRLADIPARFGGEEFVVLCPETDAAGASTVAERIRQAIMEVALKDLDGKPVRQITVSSGIATLKAGDASVADIVERADAALYASKRNGRNQWTIWQDGLVGEE